MDSLDDDQRRALAQLREITNGGDDDVAVSVLSTVDWDVQRAAELIFGTSPVGASSTQPSERRSAMESFTIDDSQQAHAVDDRPRERPRPTVSPLVAITRPLMTVLAIPLHILSSIFRFIFTILRIPIPQVRFSGLNFYRPWGYRPVGRGGQARGSGGPDRWVRELEEETGAVCVSLRSGREGVASGVDAGPSSSVNARNVGGAVEDGRKRLPDFKLSTYEETLRLCQTEARIGCVILVSAEHDDVAEFKRSTLTDASFVKILSDNNIIVWGGDVRDQEAWSAAEKLQATTYPFVAFLALQPRRNPASSASSSSRSSSAPTLTVLSRHQGRCTPSTGPTSASTLVDHLERQLFSRVSPFLERIRITQRERERDRMLRAEQDRAFRDSANRDKERIERKMEEERQALRTRQSAEEEQRREHERREREQQERQNREEFRMRWRRWIRRSLKGESKGLRIAIRFPAGSRVVHQFGPDATLTTLYAFIDAQLIPQHFGEAEDPEVSPTGDVVGVKSLERAIEEEVLKANKPAEWWGFQVVLAYPREEIAWKAGATARLADLSALRGGGQVVVELLNSAGGKRSGERERQRVPAVEDDDGYSTEDSE